MTGSCALIKNNNINSGNWIELRAQEIKWTHGAFINVPLTPSKSGIPIHEGDWMGVDNPGIVVDGLFSKDNESADVINFGYLEQLITQTGLSYFQEQYYTSGNNIFHPGSIGVFVKGFTATRNTKKPVEMVYNMTLLAASGA